MKEHYTYIGFVCIDNNGKYILITKSKEKFNITGVDGNDSLKESNLENTEAMMMTVKFFDGTESVTLDYAHNANYNDIVFAMENHGILMTDGDETVYNHINGGYENLNFFWGLLEEFYETDKGVEFFEKYKNKDNWN